MKEEVEEVGRPEKVYVAGAGWKGNVQFVGNKVIRAMCWASGRASGEVMQ